MFECAVLPPRCAAVWKCFMFFSLKKFWRFYMSCSPLVPFGSVSSITVAWIKTSSFMQVDFQESHITKAEGKSSHLLKLSGPFISFSFFRGPERWDVKRQRRTAITGELRVLCDSLGVATQTYPFPTAFERLCLCLVYRLAALCEGFHHSLTPFHVHPTPYSASLCVNSESICRPIA